jgi:hypothetical protein
MPTITIDLKDLPGELKTLGEKNIGTIRSAVQRTIEIDAQRWIQWSIRGGGSQGGYRQPIDTGNYANSWKSEMLEEGGIIYSSANPPIKSGVIEDGRRPSFIPIEPLTAWVKRKLGVTDPKAARSIAFAISKKASKTPRPGLGVLARAYPKIVEALQKNLASARGK